MFADLHLHTCFSDGTNWPEEVVQQAKQNNIGIISICDHNTIESWPRAGASCKKAGIYFIPGVEIDCSFLEHVTLHILAYDCDSTDSGFLNLLHFNRTIMEQMSIDLIEKMQSDYPILSSKEYASFRRRPENGGWKGIDYLRSKGFAISYPQCMQYYQTYKIAVCRPFFTAKEVISCIHRAGGFAVLAHPGDRLDNRKDYFYHCLELLYEQGLDGVECYYPSHSKEITRLCIDFCKQKDLLITCGSDSHGSFARYVKNVYYEIGCITPSLECLNLKKLIK